MNVGLFGYGHIGQELARKIVAMGHTISFIRNSKGFIDLNGQMLADQTSQLFGVDIVFIAMPYLNDGGEAVKNIILNFLSCKIPVVTCEKGALAYHFDEFKKSGLLKNIGYTATVGGGSRLLELSQRVPVSKIKRVDVVLNGTMNYISWRMDQGCGKETAVKEARQLHLAEPGIDEPQTVIERELTNDAPKKTAILLNRLGISQTCYTPRHFHVREIPANFLFCLSSHKRFVVSIRPPDGIVFMPEHTVFMEILNGWRVSGSFENLEGIGCRELIMPGCSNGILIHTRDGRKHFVEGAGAGPDPTTRSMLQDAHLFFPESFPAQY